MQVELIDGDGLETVYEAWQALPADPQATPFTSAQWCSSWFEHYARGARPWVLVARQHGRAVGLAPLAVRSRGALRILTMAGKEPGDYWDVLAEPALRAPVTAALADAIVRRRGVGCLVPGLPAARLTDAVRTAPRGVHRLCPCLDPVTQADAPGQLRDLPGQPVAQPPGQSAPPPASPGRRHGTAA
jgi:CelD/BcsL family acetyltransferase involved in cellulose biosynthesis